MHSETLYLLLNARAKVALTAKPGTRKQHATETTSGIEIEC